MQDPMQELAKTVKNEWRANKEGLYQPLDRDVLARVLPTYYQKLDEVPMGGPSFALVLDSPPAMMAAVDHVGRVLEEAKPSHWEALRALLPGRLYQFAEHPAAELGPNVSYHGYYFGDRDFIPGTSDWVMGAVCADDEHLRKASKLLWRDSSWSLPAAGRLDRSIPSEEYGMVYREWLNAGFLQCWTDAQLCSVAASIDLTLRAGCLRQSFKNRSSRERRLQELVDWLDLMRLPFRHARYFRNVAFFCSLPTALRRDASGRAHATSGPAIEWADGTRTYCLHGKTAFAEAPP